MKRLASITLVLVTVVCCGCSSAPVAYYTLQRPSATPSEVTSSACCTVQIRRVVIPPAVNRAELVIRDGEDEAVVLSSAMWLAPLRDEIRSALTNEIDVKLHEAASSESDAKVPEAMVFVDVTRFESVLAQYALVTANWRIQRAELPKGVSVTCEAAARIPVKGGVPALVQGYQLALMTIADHIARDLLEARANAAPRCAGD